MSKVKENNDNATSNEIINDSDQYKGKLKLIKSIDLAENYVKLFSNFPSGGFIYISFNNKIKIFNSNLNITQDIKINENENINDVVIRDEDTLLIASNNNINIYTKSKTKEEYLLTKTIKNSHNGKIKIIINFSDTKIITSSEDKKIILWEEKNKNNYNYQINTVFNLKDKNEAQSILVLQDKNLLIYSGDSGTYFLTLNKFQFCIKFKSLTWKKFSMARIDEDHIIVGRFYLFYVISLSQKKIIKDVGVHVSGINTICVIKEKGVFLIGGESNYDSDAGTKIYIHRIDNYEEIKVINNAHREYILFIVQLNHNLIASCGYDNDYEKLDNRKRKNYIRFWSLED